MKDENSLQGMKKWDGLGWRSKGTEPVVYCKLEEPPLLKAFISREGWGGGAEANMLQPSKRLPMPHSLLPCCDA